MTDRTDDAGAACGEGGFTMIEMVLVMGLLSGFLLALVNLLSSGVTVFNQGQRGQDLADRVIAAQRAAEEALGAMIGARRQSYDGEPPDARLVVSHEPLGLRYEPPGGPSAQVLRSTVRLAPDVEATLLEEELRAVAEDQLGALAGDADRVAELTTELLAATSLGGRGEMILLPWPAGDREGAFLDLRRGYRLPGEGRTWFAERELRGDGFDAATVLATTERVATGLLHFELELWSQDSSGWDREPGLGGPESSWDSARAGWLLGGATPRARFTLDLGEESLLDTRDDVWPRWIRVRLVVARSANEPPEARLAAAIGTDDRELRLTRTDTIDERAEYVKVGGEWLRFTDRGEYALRGLTRGTRGTKAAEHRAGTGVRAGRELLLYFRVPHGRESWNG